MTEAPETFTPPTHEPVQSAIHLPLSTYTEFDDPIGLVLAMADEKLRMMVADHGVEITSLRLRVEAGSVDSSEEEVVVIMIEGDRSFGWTRPADHVGEPGSEVS